MDPPLRKGRGVARLALIADDLTGAADSGVQFAKRGFSTALLLNGESVSGTEILVVDTESRTDPPEIARAKVYAAVSTLPPVKLIYKKIDSTLRGNLGAELEAIMEARSIERAILAPAFPATGRTTVGGHQLLDGLPLEKTAFAHDPLCPITDSYIPALLSRQMKRSVGLIELNMVREGVEVLAKTMRARSEAVLVVDSATEEDLHIIARAADWAGLAHLTCGSAGLADAVAEVLLPPPGGAGTSPPSPRRGPVLIAAASRNPLTARQLELVRSQLEVPIVSLSPEDLASDAEEEVKRLELTAGELLQKCDAVVLDSTSTTYISELSEEVARALGQVVSRLADQYHLAGLVLTGGDVALAVCRALRAKALSLVGEVAPGIPLAHIQGGPHSGLPVVTKAGGFGREEAIITAIRHLRGTTH